MAAAGGGQILAAMNAAELLTNTLSPGKFFFISNSRATHADE